MTKSGLLLRITSSTYNKTKTKTYIGNIETRFPQNGSCQHVQKILNFKWHNNWDIYVKDVNEKAVLSYSGHSYIAFSWSIPISYSSVERIYNLSTYYEMREASPAIHASFTGAYFTFSTIFLGNNGHIGLYEILLV